MRTPLHQLAAAAGLAILFTSRSFAQSEPTKPVDPAVKQAQDRLPGDQPKGTTSSATSSPAAATTTTATSSSTTVAQPSEAEMMKMMMEMSKLNENHKLLGQLAGTWTFTSKMWMDPKGPPTESNGNAVRKAVLDGHYYLVDFAGKFPMPGPDGKMKEMDFTGMSIEGYDNAKQKFVVTWCDSMSTGVFVADGTYDAATKTFTYTGEYQLAPSMKQKVRQTVKVVDNDHHIFDYYENRGGSDVKTMEIAYTRKK
ncbi:MAG: DUF1579 domain-containing protein [Verrucomicrobiota bacterium]|nr:DUF1579 domain-containing protein [Verrucomicrobiota bacterium]